MKSKYTGTWRIAEMEGWDADYVDLTGPAYLTISRDGSGFMQYGAIKADLDHRIEDFDNTQRLEFSFQGFDEGDPISGRGSATIEGKEMAGHIYIYYGDEAPFKAVRTSAAKIRSAPKVIRLPRQILPAGNGLEARIYSAEVLFKQRRPPLAQFARDLGVVAEIASDIEEDSWGTRDSLEIWFQEIEGRKLSLHIQRAHFRRREIYERDLQNFLAEVEALPYVQRIQIEKQ